MAVEAKAIGDALGEVGEAAGDEHTLGACRFHFCNEDFGAGRNGHVIFVNVVEQVCWQSF